jgi:hypothetical protein
MEIVEQFPCTNPALRPRPWVPSPEAIYKVCLSNGAIPANVQKCVDKFSRTEKERLNNSRERTGRKSEVHENWSIRRHQDGAIEPECSEWMSTASTYEIEKC